MTSLSDTHLLPAVEEYVSNFFEAHIPKLYIYHDLSHTRDVARVARLIGEAFRLNEEDLLVLQIAAWFHDTGYDLGADNHEGRSVGNMQEFFRDGSFQVDRMEEIKNCILATRFPQKPESLLQKIICDADLSHLGEKTYWIKSSYVRHELVVAQRQCMTEPEWLDFELHFMTSHAYHTQIARDLFDRRKHKHILQLRKQRARLFPLNGIPGDDLFPLDKEQPSGKKKTNWRSVVQDKAEASRKESFGRGVETMYQAAYNTHNNLSALADHKVNQMLSVNTIMIAIMLAMMAPRLNESPQFLTPTVVLLTVCLASIVLATLSARPKITHGEVTLDDIRQKRSNLLFFGNFHNMKLEDYQWGMLEMIKDADFQYTSMTRDLYFLGRVLAQKYKYLTYCYNIFMFGMILSVLLFTIAFVNGPPLAIKIK